MARRLPSLKAVQAFEVAARLASFSKAAAELLVTHAAISRQVRGLEEWLGSRLFVRAGRGVVPTEAANAYQLVLTDLFDRLEVAIQHVSRRQSDRIPKQSVSIHLASRGEPELVGPMAGTRSCVSRVAIERSLLRRDASGPDCSTGRPGTRCW